MQPTDHSVRVRSYIVEPGRGPIALEDLHASPALGGVVEGALHLSIEGRAILTSRLTGPIEMWWDQLLDACEAIMASSRWEGALAGTAVMLHFIPIGGTNRLIAAASEPGQDLADVDRASGSTLVVVEALLTACATYLDAVTPQRPLHTLRQRLDHLRANVASRRR